MKRSKYPQEQIVRILREVGAGAKVVETCRKYGGSEPTFYATRDEMRTDVFDHIERFCNPRRRHATLGQMSPIECETRCAGLAKCP